MLERQIDARGSSSRKWLPNKSKDRTVEAPVKMKREADWSQSES